MGEVERIRMDEIAPLKPGVELGLTHIDTVEMDADGQAEEIVFTLTPEDLSAREAEHRR